METRLILVRHGQTIWNQAHRYAGSGEVALSAEGESQIFGVTAELKDETIDAIYSSPLTRCLETIRPTAANHHLRIIKHEGLRERNLGAWEGHSPEEIHPVHAGYHFPESAYDGSFQIEDAETLEELETRVRHMLGEVVDAHPGQQVVLMTHAGIIWIIQARIVHNPPHKLHWPGNCAIARVTTEGHHHYHWDGVSEQSEYALPVTQVLVPA